MTTPAGRNRPPGETGGSDQRPARRLVGAALHFDLAAELKSLKGEATWQQRDRDARTLVEETGIHVTLVALKEGALMREHRAPGWVSIQALDGRMRVQAPGQAVDLTPGDVLVLDRGVPHDVEALAESAFLLTVAAPERDPPS